MAKKTKEQRISAEKRRLNGIYAGLAPEKKMLAVSLIERAAFMRVECEDLEKDLLENGWTEKFRQGDKQDPYDRARPQGQSYLSMNTSYQKIIKQLDGMLPAKEVSTSDGFDEFLAAGEQL